MVIVTQFQHPESPILHQQQNARIILDRKDLGLGTIYISERTLSWQTQAGPGFCIEYRHIAMHAITTDPSIYPTQCIYIMIDDQIKMPDDNIENLANDRNDNSDDESETSSEPNISQMVLVPADITSIQTIYNALSHCQSLNPDPNDVADDDENVYEDAEDYEDEYVNNERISSFGGGGDSDMNFLSSQLHNHSISTHQSYGNGDQNFDDEQFEDAD